MIDQNRIPSLIYIMIELNLHVSLSYPTTYPVTSSSTTRTSHLGYPTIIIIIIIIQALRYYCAFILQGCNLLLYLESLVGEDHFEAFVKSYIET